MGWRPGLAFSLLDAARIPVYNLLGCILGCGLILEFEAGALAWAQVTTVGGLM